MKRPSQRFIHKRSLARSLARSFARSSGQWEDKVDRNLRLRCAKSFLDVTPRPSYEDTFARRRSDRSRARISRYRPRAARIIIDRWPFSALLGYYFVSAPVPTWLHLPFIPPCDTLSPLSYFSARIPSSHRFFFDSDLKGGKRVYARAKGRRIRLIWSGKWVSFHGSPRFSFCYPFFSPFFFHAPCESTVP